MVQKHARYPARRNPRHYQTLTPNVLALFRFPNLLIVLLTQYILQYLVIIPALADGQVAPQLNPLHFFLLSLTTVLIAAGGYVINDLLDYPIDLINKPRQLIIGRKLSVLAARQWYWGIHIAGLGLAIYLAFHVNAPGLALIYPAAAGLLYLYSKYFKKQVLIGNLVIALFCSFVAGIVWFAERESYTSLQQSAPEAARQMAHLMIAYMSFAFISTLFREIIKDMEDMEGDAAYACRTLPIVGGIRLSSWLVTLLGILLAAALLFWAFGVVPHIGPLSLGFLMLAIVAPLLWTARQIWLARQKSDFSKLSRRAKFIMAAGLLLLCIFCLE